MSSGRYALELHEEPASGRGKGNAGLGLRVRDGWTGEQRDTSTLSGGESFFASLSLALGLAETVGAEAGGLDLGTLFITTSREKRPAEEIDAQPLAGRVLQLRVAARRLERATR